MEQICIGIAHPVFVNHHQLPVQLLQGVVEPTVIGIHRPAVVNLRVVDVLHRQAVVEQIPIGILPVVCVKLPLHVQPQQVDVERTIIGIRHRVYVNIPEVPVQLLRAVAQ
ncbi:MAG: hypothetical protein A2161_06060 [Candidatus Schekmanbacteria bacterium RBG_13_48_7]|uniref:Uncharacterized protein n=1 Tax=Candidatus Schekmanbacteria bacterium RBG_13_48_7 TaxID=1817878 RepID=A0A1F7RQG2_9BACT|nr:MAG: hypothetical protein A2161_06060 [Candidatus Schekmanbacteria bacterium RBG_13_48_7]